MRRVNIMLVGHCCWLLIIVIIIIIIIIIGAFKESVVIYVGVFGETPSILRAGASPVNR
jgi:hypothetical protein